MRISLSTTSKTMKTFFCLDIFRKGLSKRFVINFRTSPIFAKNTMLIGMPMAAMSIDVIFPMSVCGDLRP
jgi:hypothetical protein